jgi:hypothetical protein
MNTRYLLIVALLAQLLLAGQVRGQDKEPSSGDDDFKAVQVKLAETRLSLGELELKVAQEANRKDKGLVPEVVIESLRQSLAKSKVQLATAKGDSKAVDDAIAASADLSVEIASTRLKRLEEIRQKTGDVGTSSLERAKLRLKVAELERASMMRMKDLPVEQQLRWQIDRINAMIDGISDRVIVLEDRR